MRAVEFNKIILLHISFISEFNCALPIKLKKKSLNCLIHLNDKDLDTFFSIILYINYLIIILFLIISEILEEE